MGFEVVGELFDEPHDPRNHQNVTIVGIIL
jgi:hypothetical protein